MRGICKGMMKTKDKRPKIKDKRLKIKDKRGKLNFGCIEKPLADMLQETKVRE